MTEREALKLALEALEANLGNWNAKAKAIPIIKEALAQPEQKPVALYEDWYHPNSCEHCGMVGGHTKICRHSTTPPQRKPLPPKSPCEMTQAMSTIFKLGWLECEAAHGIRE